MRLPHKLNTEVLASCLWVNQRRHSHPLLQELQLAALATAVRAASTQWLHLRIQQISTQAELSLVSYTAAEAFAFACQA